MCLNEERLPLFDILCLSYFLNNSNTSWNHLHLPNLYDHETQILTNTLTNNSQQNQCKTLEVFPTNDDSQIIETIILTQYSGILFYCTLYYIPVDLCLVILQLLNLPLKKELDLLTQYLELKIESTNSILHTDKYSELETCIAMNSTLLEMDFQFKYNGNPTVISKTITSLINGVTVNKTITSFSLEVDNIPLLPDRTIKHLLKYNHTLQLLKLNINDPLLLSSLNTVEVNTPLTTLEINSGNSNKLHSFLIPKEYTVLNFIPWCVGDRHGTL